jgi:hypothetical protein
MTSTVVHGDASGKGDTLVHLDLVVNLGSLILDLLVGSGAELDDGLLRDDVGQDLVHNSYYDHFRQGKFNCIAAIV